MYKARNLFHPGYNMAQALKVQLIIKYYVIMVECNILLKIFKNQ